MRIVDKPIVVEFFTVEYSPIQKKFHIQELEDSLKMNRASLASGREPHYHIVCVANSFEVAQELVEELRNMFHENRN